MRYYYSGCTFYCLQNYLLEHRTDFSVARQNTLAGAHSPLSIRFNDISATQKANIAHIDWCCRPLHTSSPILGVNSEIIAKSISSGYNFKYNKSSWLIEMKITESSQVNWPANSFQVVLCFVFCVLFFCSKYIMNDLILYGSRII